MPLSPNVARWLHTKGHLAEHASEVGLSMASDVQIMQYAEDAQAIVLTADLDYPQLLALSHASSPAVILFRKGNFSDSEVIHLLGKVLDTLTPEAICQSLTVIDRQRVRIRRLPL